MTFEERFGCEIAQEDAEQMKTVGDAIRYIEKHQSA
jgi:acyl carrier protein